MSITLRPEHEKAVAAAIRSGAYQNADEVIERALEALRAEDELLHGQGDEISAKIDRALAQFERGEFFTPEESQADLEKRWAAWLADHKR